jgi:hypothetical protein
VTSGTAAISLEFIEQDHHELIEVNQNLSPALEKMEGGYMQDPGVKIRKEVLSISPLSQLFFEYKIAFAETNKHSE